MAASGHGGAAGPAAGGDHGDGRGCDLDPRPGHPSGQPAAAGAARTRASQDPPAAAPGRLLPPTATRVQAGRVSYCRYDGIFEGRTSTGAFRVPYRLSTSGHPRHGDGTVIVEPSHFAIGLGLLEQRLQPDLIFGNGFTHAGIGWSTASFGPGADLRILDPTVPGVFIEGGFVEENGRTDHEIIAEFARTLAVDDQARAVLGSIKRRYLAGLSDSTIPVLDLVTTGRATGVSDLALAVTTEFTDPQLALQAGAYPGKVIIVNSEIDVSGNLIDRGVVPGQYRFYAVAGTPHIPDDLDVSDELDRTTPASYVPALRAHFLQADRWVRHGTPPPASYHLQKDGSEVVRDASGNALVLDTQNRPVPRLPFLELGEARFVGDFIGGYDNVRSIAEIGFSSHRAYLDAFAQRLADYAAAGYITKKDAADMRARAALCAPSTFTQTYRDHYDNFVTITRCPYGDGR
ncbi:alpha/beta hydrolase domain-containing protein [Catellatospora sichuanensis]|uniref:alpha/beta hydrolase domain-containing protein n=1 Tax=Catellatospora sichuanensis TaxID=1969805 RepID=UPI0011842AB7|nr:alpha/beta hydrolase domain-containing protein [Catellatospora sichuanensis]